MHELDYWLSESQLLAHPHYEIYQLKEAPETRELQFMRYEKGKTISRDNYSLVFANICVDIPNDNELLDSLFFTFNHIRPFKYQGHSISVSDVIVLQDGEHRAAYYVDSIGFKEIPEFLEKTIQSEM